MKKIKKRKKEKHIFSWILMIVLIIIVFCLSALIFNTDYLSPKIDELTTSYISFNNVESTDIIKISILVAVSVYLSIFTDILSVIRNCSVK